MNKFWTDICLMPFAALLAVGLLWGLRQVAYENPVPATKPENVFNPINGRDYGSIERACSRYFVRMSSNDVAIKMAEDTKQELIKRGILKNG